MYSPNDYRYYLEYRLMQSDDFLAHYNHNHDAMGRFAPSGTGGYYRLTSRYAKNAAKIDKYQGKLDASSGQRRDVKAAKYKAKQDKLDAKAAKARKKLAKGKTLSEREMKKIARAESNQAKLSKTSAKNDKYRAKITKLQAKNARIDKRLDKMEARDEKYRQRELHRLELDRAGNTAKGAQKVNKLNAKGKTDEARVADIHTRHKNADIRAEMDYVEKMSTSDLRSERHKANLIGGVGGTATALAQVPVAALTGVPFVYAPNGTYATAYKHSSRQKQIAADRKRRRELSEAFDREHGITKDPPYQPDNYKPMSDEQIIKLANQYSRELNKKKSK